jgi:SAM-dependent methyltransferase
LESFNAAVDTTILKVLETTLQSADRLGMPVGRHKGPKTGHPYRDIDPRQFWARKYLSLRHLRGDGLEIGAMHCPLDLYCGAKAKYVDCFDVAEARKHYPELADFELVTPDYIENGEILPSIPPASQDFIIANHFIEHCEDPIGTISNLLDKLKSGGMLFMAVPMRDFTFDRERAITPIAHLVRDHKESPEVSRREHYYEWARYVAHAAPADLDKVAADLMEQRYSIHYHVWNFEAFKEFLSHLQNVEGLPFTLLDAISWKYNPFESVFLLKKR